MASITLPPAYKGGSLDDAKRYLSDLIEFISSPLAHSVIVSHLNNIAGGDSSAVPGIWDDLWNNSWIDNLELQEIVRRLLNNDLSEDSPPSLKSLAQAVQDLSLPRKASEKIPQFRLIEKQRFGLTPKKQHEVERMCAFVKAMANYPGDSEDRRQVQHLVDVGAGQGYLTRNLADVPLSFELLALDSNEDQVEGAKKRQQELERWQKKVFGRRKTSVAKETSPDGPSAASPDTQAEVQSSRPGSVTQATVFVDKDALPAAIDQWIKDQMPSTSETPVIIVGLHACGSLTPAVLRSFVSLYHTQKEEQLSPRAWRCAGLALVGCCYNRIRGIEKDFPMSSFIANHSHRPLLRLESLHLHLAAQVTHNWLSDWPAFELGLRKIVFRALFERLFSEHGGKMYQAGLQVGRFNDAAYESWDTYLARAAERLDGVTYDDLKKREVQANAKASTEGYYNARLRRRLEVLHVLRCMLGPVVESMLLVDRWMYLREELDEQVDVKMVNMFDQSTGSARNVALVVRL
ncbi:hypothetical protein FS837_000099 [Tulasnella sp. UAMH 9824]|nr:hypothetical protein FS837_000099 [Tulasnella sp. UAMH 9824]